MAASDIADIAFERAWRVYRLINRNESQYGERRQTLEAFIRKCCEKGAADAEAIVVLALIHLKQLDELAAHRAKSPARSRSGKNGTNDPASG
jgi:hypothetical protein